MRTPSLPVAIIATLAVAGVTYAVAITAPFIVAFVAAYFYWQSIGKEPS